MLPYALGYGVVACLDRAEMVNAMLSLADNLAHSHHPLRLAQWRGLHILANVGKWDVQLSELVLHAVGCIYAVEQHYVGVDGDEKLVIYIVVVTHVANLLSVGSDVVVADKVNARHAHYSLHLANGIKHRNMA